MSHQSRTSQKMTKTNVRIKTQYDCLGKPFRREACCHWTWSVLTSFNAQISWSDATLKRDADYLCHSGSCFVSSCTRIMKCACFHWEFLASAHLKLCTCTCVTATADTFREHSMTHIRHSKTGCLNQLHPLAPRRASIHTYLSHGSCSSLGEAAPFNLNRWKWDVAKQGGSTGAHTPDTSKESVKKKMQAVDYDN